MPESDSLVNHFRAFFYALTPRGAFRRLYPVIGALALRLLRQVLIRQVQENALFDVAVKRADTNRGFERPAL